jgi:NADH-quinone oxidoreductase subunit K
MHINIIYLIIFLAIFIIVIGLACIFLARKTNLILILISIELILLSINILFVSFSIILDDILGYFFTFFILTIAASESAIGLAILIIFYRIHSSINIDLLSYIKA